MAFAFFLFLALAAFGSLAGQKRSYADDLRAKQKAKNKAFMAKHGPPNANGYYTIGSEGVE